MLSTTKISHNDPLRYSGQWSSVSSNSVMPEVPQAYQNLIAANPYRNVDFSESPWQKFLHRLGFRTQADAWRENMTVQANEYDAGILQKAYDEDFNDAQSQVARMRQAGLNPDLDPSSVSSGEAAPMGEDPSLPMQSTGEEQVIMTVANGVMSAFSDALGMVQMFQGIKKNNIQNSILQTQQEQEETNLFDSLSLLMLPEATHPDDIQNFDWKGASIRNAEKYAKEHFDSKKGKRFIDYQTRFFESAVGQGESYESFKKRIQERRSESLERSTMYDEIAYVLDVITAPLGEAASKLFSARQSADIAKAGAEESIAAAEVAEAQTTLAYQTALDGSLLGKAENAKAEKASAEDETLSILNQSVLDIVKGLEDVKKEGGFKGILAGLAIPAIQLLRLWLSSVGMPHFGMGQFSGPKGTGSSFNFGW